MDMDRCRTVATLPLMLLLLAPLADSYSRGAPEAQCGYMTPKHGHQPQQSRPYAAIALGAAVDSRRAAPVNICPGNQIAVTLYSDSGRFKGFFMRAEDANALEKRALGSFLLNDTSYGSPAQYVHCHGTPQSALTHTGWVFSSNRLMAIWRAPSNFTGRVRFRATVVESYETYWKNVVSPLLEVSFSGPECQAAVLRDPQRIITSFGSAARPQRPSGPSPQQERTVTQLTRRPRQRAPKATDATTTGTVKTAAEKKITSKQTSPNSTTQTPSSSLKSERTKTPISSTYAITSTSSTPTKTTNASIAPTNSTTTSTTTEYDTTFKETAPINTDEPGTTSDKFYTTSSTVESSKVVTSGSPTPAVVSLTAATRKSSPEHVKNTTRVPKTLVATASPLSQTATSETATTTRHATRTSPRSPAAIAPSPSYPKRQRQKEEGDKELAKRASKGDGGDSESGSPNRGGRGGGGGGGTGEEEDQREVKIGGLTFGGGRSDGGRISATAGLLAVLCLKFIANL